MNRRYKRKRNSYISENSLYFAYTALALPIPAGDASTNRAAATSISNPSDVGAVLGGLLGGAAGAVTAGVGAGAAAGAAAGGSKGADKWGKKGGKKWGKWA
ncbi:hypothetical protein GGTG_02404 [Gaeumannomyces tritici R3-111a-1]|uniref:Uncharacterized protein n=1 Tax=Gaeumannomyces tritici (strain R3-111a-1) TaxID=644352 RepID=J3NMA0_GAET3|nr:hypothetical protein GGTG_02404 [Gaeumannomyces tritici R3-111a-1]EJT82431.1 hypothetical protein GGTG_02404 [Gaeumannomyces tritici R3-111a-1]